MVVWCSDVVSVDAVQSRPSPFSRRSGLAGAIIDDIDGIDDWLFDRLIVLRERWGENQKMRGRRLRRNML